MYEAGDGYLLWLRLRRSAPKSYLEVREMTRRCIMIIPELEEAHRIEAVREKYDPLHGIVKPHITLVFPFGSDLTKDELRAHILSALSGYNPFPLVMSGVSARREPDGCYIYLNVAEGQEIIRRISGQLYEGVLSTYKSGRYDAYAPHITLGKLPDEAALQSALTQIGEFPYKFSTTVRSVCVEVIGQDGASEVEMIFQLSQGKSGKR
jgi:2'-5' RNA ligase